MTLSVFGNDPIYDRVDATAVCEDKKVTPMDILAEKRQQPSFVADMLSLLAEFTEMPDHVKITYLSNLMYKDKPKAKDKEKFKNILSSLSIELVSGEPSFKVLKWQYMHGQT